jgi:hypothetical protein
MLKVKQDSIGVYQVPSHPLGVKLFYLFLHRRALQQLPSAGMRTDLCITCQLSGCSSVAATVRTQIRVVFAKTDFLFVQVFNCSFSHFNSFHRIRYPLPLCVSNAGSAFGIAFLFSACFTSPFSIEKALLLFLNFRPVFCNIAKPLLV